MAKKLQLPVQLLFLTLFIILIATGRVQVWVGIFLIGLVGSLFLGRFYCGWFCPINTVMNGVTWIKETLGIKKQRTPVALTRPWVRYTVLVLFFSLFAFSMITGRAIPALPALFAVGIVVTVFFPEETWHHFLCPYSTILSLPSKGSKYNMVIDQNNCNSCGICRKICPADAVQVCDRVYAIDKSSCLVCHDCAVKCRAEAICYKSDRKVAV